MGCLSYLIGATRATDRQSSLHDLIGLSLLAHFVVDRAERSQCRLQRGIVRTADLLSKFN